MSNKVWTWFSKLGHWIALGAKDADKFLLAIQQSGILTLIPGVGGIVNASVGIFEKIIAGNTAVEQVSATLAQSGTILTSAQKLTLATPDALAAFVAYAQAAGLKITDMSKAAQIAQGVASLGADFLNILEPASGAKLPTPSGPSIPAAPTPTGPTQPPTTA
jgi:hypothetical protein